MTRSAKSPAHIPSAEPCSCGRSKPIHKVKLAPSTTNLFLPPGSSPRSDAQHLFQQVFWPLYPPEIRAHPHQPIQPVTVPANDCACLELIDEIADSFRHLAAMVLGLPSDSLDDSDQSVDRLGAALTRQRRDLLLREQTLGRPPCPLLATVVIHGTVYVARCIVLSYGAQWIVRRPIWETTVVLDGQQGAVELPIFHWWLMALGDQDIDRMTLGDQYRAHVQSTRT